ncbi:MAG: RDD family protein, partial [Elusimicrobiota bacterium]|nr:RDD family protein [Elusimicrobiota bacterium]
MYAGFWKRFIAYIIDSIIVTIIGWILFAVLGIILSAIPGDTSGNNALSLAASVGATLVGFIIGILLNIIYFALFESSSAQASPGKMVLGIKVTDINGKRLTFWRAVGRTIAKWVSNLTFSIGYLMAGFTRRRQALHDMIADCLVIDKNADTNNLQPLPPTPVWQIVLIIFAVCILPIILGILTAIALPQYFRAVEKSRSVEALSVMNSIAGAQERHRLISGKYTLNFDDLDLDFSGRGTV